MNNYLTVLAAEADSAHRSAVLERELAWARQHGGEPTRRTAGAPTAPRHPLQWLRRLVGAAA